MRRNQPLRRALAGSTEAQLAALKKAGMALICEQNRVGLAHRDDPTIVGWMHGDEPDNSQEVRDPKTGRRGYGPCVPPSRIVADYERLRAADPTRPIMLNLGQGVANDDWKGRGPGASLDDYPGYVRGWTSSRSTSIRSPESTEPTAVSSSGTSRKASTGW